MLCLRAHYEAYQGHDSGNPRAASALSGSHISPVGDSSKDFGASFPGAGGTYGREAERGEKTDVTEPQPSVGRCAAVPSVFERCALGQLLHARTTVARADETPGE